MSEAAPMPAARLKAARELRGLSPQKAADELHLESWVIEALEAGEYQRIGPTVYSKGYLKRYAALLGLPVEEMLAGFGGTAAVTEAPTPATVKPETPAPARTFSSRQMAAASAVMLLAVALAWWKPWEQHPSAPLASSEDPALDTPRAAEIPADVPVAAKDHAEPVAALPPGGSGAARKTALAPAPRGPLAPSLAMSGRPPGTGPDVGAGGGAVVDATQLPGAGRARLRLSFTADSWVDVRDALGNRAFAGTGSANTVKNIAGQAPMHVYLRSASGVQLEINGRVVAIGPQYFAGDVARFEAGADGVLRRESRRDATAANTRPSG